MNHLVELADPIFTHLSYDDSISFAHCLSQQIKNPQYDSNLAKILSAKYFQQISANTIEGLRLLSYVGKLCFKKNKDIEIYQDWMDIKSYTLNGVTHRRIKNFPSKDFLKQILSKIYLQLGCHSSNGLNTRSSRTFKKRHISLNINCNYKFIDIQGQRYSFIFSHKIQQSDIYKIYKKRADILKQSIENNTFNQLDFHDIIEKISNVNYNHV